MITIQFDQGGDGHPPRTARHYLFGVIYNRCIYGAPHVNPPTSITLAVFQHNHWEIEN